jgi:hypothetical protein
LGTNAPLALDADIAILYLNNRDWALSLPRPGAKTLSLLSYRQKRQQQALDTLAQAAFYRSLVAECQAEIHRLIEEADTPEKRREALPQVQKLQQVAEEAGRHING